MKNSKLFIFQHGDGGIYADDNDSYNIAWHKKFVINTLSGVRIPRMDIKFFLHKKCLEKNRQFLSSKRKNSINNVWFQ